MILYDTSIPVSLQEFGIQIPIRDSRTVKTLDALCRDPQLGPARHKWLLDRITERLTRQDLLRVHTRAYVQDLFTASRLERHILAIYELITADGRYHRYDPQAAARPLADLFDRILLKAAGSAQCGLLALRHGFCFYFAGGMHHAHADHGSGFCPINDIVIAARKLQAEKKVRTVWIIDVDAHKGDGTAALTAGDETIRTLSIHMAAGWPLDGPPVLADNKPNPVFIPSDIDIPIHIGQQAGYIERLNDGLNRMAAFERADLAIVVCGADPYEKDELPSTQSLKLTLEQMLQRDQLVYNFLKSNNIPGAYLMAGGYGEDVWKVYAQFLCWALKDGMRG